VIQCSNPQCRALTSLPASCCQTCKTPLHYRFLLAVGDGALEFSPGALVADRYRVWAAGIWLDTHPELPVTPLEVLPRFVVPYLRLASLPHHVSRPFTLLLPEDGIGKEPVLLLDAAPIGTRLTEHGEIEPFLLPTLDAAWAKGSALQQLNWLRQLAQLWEPLAQEQVAATLLQPDALRVDHALLRVAQLTLDVQNDQAATLSSLGRRWESFLPQAQAQVRPYLETVVRALLDQTITSGHGLVAELDQAVRALATGLAVDIDWVAYTDQGPERSRNEDACHPQGQRHQVHLIGHDSRDMPLLLVCDGIGGHEQGNVASETAIKMLLQELQPLGDGPAPSPRQVEAQLHRALALANDAIAARNNSENRAARARMGTTVVLALVHFPYVSIAHLGDSRAYRISDRTCYQITLDDDIASRETRLGYALYPEALQVPNGGALIQALGIGDSAQLYPTVHHLLIDDPMVLLLCSDGLSDYDRVDMLWQHYLSPLVSSAPTGAMPATGQTLIQLANQLNGHDNVTVGLLRFMPTGSTYSALPGALYQLEPDAAPADTRAITPLMAPDALAADAMASDTATADTTALQSDVIGVEAGKGRSLWPLVLVATVLAALSAGLAAWMHQLRQPRPMAIPALTLPLAIARDQANSLAAMAWVAQSGGEVGSFWQVGHGTPFRSPQGLALQPRPVASESDRDEDSNDNIEPPSTAAADALFPSMVATGSILKVENRRTSADQTNWVRLEVCSIPSGVSLDQVPQETDSVVPSMADNSVANTPELNRLASPGDSGWVLEGSLYLAATPVDQPTTTQRGTCTP
jgi:serine/threonine protein phosphatase PrpC